MGERIPTPSSPYAIFNPVREVAAMRKKRIRDVPKGREIGRLESRSENNTSNEKPMIIINGSSRSAVLVGYLTSKRAADRYFSLHSVHTIEIGGGCTLWISSAVDSTRVAFLPQGRTLQLNFISPFGEGTHLMIQNP